MVECKHSESDTDSPARLSAANLEARPDRMSMFPQGPACERGHSCAYLLEEPKLREDETQVKDIGNPQDQSAWRTTFLEKAPEDHAGE